MTTNPTHPLFGILRAFGCGTARFSGLALVFCLLLPGCKKNLYPDNQAQNELVVLAEISADEPLKIPVSKSVQVGNGGVITFDKVTTAKVTITSDQGPSWTCKLNSSTNYANDPASIYTSSQRPVANSTYRLRVEDPLSGTVTATTTIPSRPHLVKWDTSYGNRGGRQVLQWRVLLMDPPDTSNQYIFEALKELLRIQHLFTYQGKSYNYDTKDGKDLYNKVKGQPGIQLRTDTQSTNTYLRLHIYTDDRNVDNAKVSTLDSPFARIFLPDKVFSGQPYTETVMVDPTYFRAAAGQGPGRVLLILRSASSELYNYLFWYEQYKADISTLPPDQLYSPPGNIQNGLGIFGGSAKRQWVYYFDDLH